MQTNCSVKDCPNFGKYWRYCGHGTAAGPKPATPLPKKSDKRKSEDKEYSRLRKSFLSGHPKCQVAGCRKVSEEVHHKAGRTGSNFLDSSKWMAVCPSHHRKITDDPKWAIENNYSLSRISSPSK